ncbi:SIMPL domain-containing protein [Qipengyuania sp. SS22]|uniref:SIMPL domain-containing protein n=1 Tax=Qipengyuania sp. SS22 TaxID=2979461 RepID=UPI0021E56F2F|nr:SIMPL domain-containing protein [Qipengyuania sp. SS22]UYH55144.1 SIMPL domain-containing protein [Qipengyuania sp. SS22]
MPEETENVHNGATPRHSDATLKRWLGSAGIVALGLIVGGFVLGDGLVRMKAAERSVTVRGLAEREVTADLATWTVSFASTATNLQTAQANTDRDAEAVRAFFDELGFPEGELTPAGINVSSYTNDGTVFYTVRQRSVLRTRDIDRAQRAVRRQAELVRDGVVLEDGSGISYTFTGLNEIKPEMVAEATKDARAAAEQFAQDSGAAVGGIHKATQGYFSINARDGEAGGWGIGDTPFKKVRVVTTVDFALD